MEEWQEFRRYREHELPVLVSWKKNIGNSAMSDIF